MCCALFVSGHQPRAKYALSESLALLFCSGAPPCNFVTDWCRIFAYVTLASIIFFCTYCAYNSYKHSLRTFVSDLQSCCSTWELRRVVSTRGCSQNMLIWSSKFNRVVPPESCAELSPLEFVLWPPNYHDRLVFLNRLTFFAIECSIFCTNSSY